MDVDELVLLYLFDEGWEEEDTKPYHTEEQEEPDISYRYVNHDGTR